MRRNCLTFITTEPDDLMVRFYCSFLRDEFKIFFLHYLNRIFVFCDSKPFCKTLHIKTSDKNTAIERLSALNGVIPVYTESDLENGIIPDRIPDPLEFEELKENILKNTYFACLRAMGQQTDDAETAAARKFIAEFNQTHAPSYESLRTRDAMETLYELWTLKDKLRDFEQAWPYRIVWPLWKIYAFSRCLKENGWRYTLDRIRNKPIFK